MKSRPWRRRTIPDCTYNGRSAERSSPDHRAEVSSMLRSATMRAFIGCFGLLAGCERLPMDPTTLEVGTAASSIDGEAWTSSEATWVSNGDGVQINTAEAGGWWITLVAQQTEDGVTVGDAVDADAQAKVLPARVTLHDGAAGGFATLYRTEGGSLTTAAGGGTLWLTHADDDEIQGCFEFDATDRDGERVAVRRGGFRATPL